MNSMTGYGRGCVERVGRRIVVEIRSVNHRYLDTKLRGVTLAPAIEERITSVIKKGIERGAITVTTRTESRGGEGDLRVDEAAARRAQQELDGLAAALHLDGKASLSLICAQPGVLVAHDTGGDDESLAASVVEALAQAVSALYEMRSVEGAALRRDLESRLDHLAELTAEVGKLAAQAPEEAQQRLEERLRRLLQGNKIEVDPNRLAQEVAILADRHDVTEELVRLDSHIDQVRSVMAEGGVVGRRLGFLVQELGRELNTISAKSQSAEIARVVVEAKAELEKMREQVQNIE